MKIVRHGDPATRQGTTFTGPTELTTMLSPQQPGGVALTIVRFENGARTHWHIHPGEQVLYVLDGRGRVGTDAEEVEIGPGDVVYAPPGERHWHGAAPGASMTHISITTIGQPQWLEPPE